MQAVRYAKNTLRKYKHMKVTAKMVAAVETLARSDPRLVMTADQFDADPWLLNA
jgi:hypothetical protein